MTGRPGTLRADIGRGWRYAFARRRKAVTAVVALLVQLVAANVLHGNALLVASVVIVVAGGKSVEVVANRRPAPGPD